MSAAEASLLTLAAVCLGFIIGVVYATWRDERPVVIVVPESSPLDDIPTPGVTPSFIPDYFYDQDTP